MKANQKLSGKLHLKEATLASLTSNNMHIVQGGLKQEASLTIDLSIDYYTVSCITLGTCNI